MQSHENTVFKQLESQYHDKRLGHAFLLESNNSEKSLEQILNFLKKINCEENYSDNCVNCNLCHLIETKHIPSLMIISPDGQQIKREQIQELKRNFQTKPIFSKYNMYVILNAELLNSSSANAMLKFLEEPDDNIIGFFVTDNKENVIDTIRSRCQIFLDYYNEIDVQMDSKIDDLAISFIKESEIAKEATLLFIKNEVLPVITDKAMLTLFFQKLLSTYQQLYLAKILNRKLDIKYKEIEFLLKRDVEDLSFKLNLVKELLDSLEYNVNGQLVLERFVLESRC